MDIYPFHKDLQEEVKKFDKGNFSLWFNKILFKVDENSGKLENDTAWAENIFKKYQKMSKNKEIQILLDEKIKNQKDFSEQLSQKYKFIQFEGKLKSDFIIGLGENHPTETGIILDHTIGVPYIPASTIKGAVRFAYSLNYIDENKEKNDFKEKISNKGELLEENTPITRLFGGTQEDDNEYVGKIIFLDSYCEKTPTLKLDVMTPHYSEYYKDGKKAPADNQDPTPIKFLSIEKGQRFIFNVLINTDILDEKDNIEKAFKRALETEGIGAKTAIGYGRFEVKVIEHKSKEEILKEKEDKYVKSISNNIFNFDSWQADIELKNNKNIAQKIFDSKKLINKTKKIKKDGINSKDYTKEYKVLAEILGLKLEELNTIESNKKVVSSENINTDEVRSNLTKTVLALIEKSKLSKRESKKLEKLIKKIKNEFPDLINELNIE